MKNCSIFFRCLVLLALMGVVVTQGHAQESKDDKKEKTVKRVVSPTTKPHRSWSISITPGIANSFADVKKKNFFGGSDASGNIKENQFGINASVTKMFSGAFGVQGQFFYSKLVGVADGDTKYVEDRRFLENLGITEPIYFESNVIQGSVNFYWNISNTVFGVNRHLRAKRFGRKVKPRVVSIYTFAGVGLAQFSEPGVRYISNDQLLTNQALTPIPGKGSNSYLTTTNDKLVELVIPVGGGIKFRVSKDIDLGIEAQGNFSLEDKIDGLVFDHPRRTKNDKYSLLGLNINWKIGGKKQTKEHVEWVNPTESFFADMSRVEGKVDKISRDTDRDGVSDAFDKDLNTPEGIRVDGSGLPLDVDLDGVPDYEDLEPFSDKDATVDDFGKSLDSDQDGVPDHRDREANTPAGAMVNFEGMSIQDNLQIELPDYVRQLRLPSVYFDYNRTTIQSQYETRLNEVARVLKENQGLKLMVVGHTDDRGSEKYNDGLGQRRAEKVANYLIENYSIPAASLVVVSRGESAQMSRKRKLNRRVDFEVAE